MDHLLDIMAGASGISTDPAFATAIAPAPGAFLDADRLFRRRRVVRGGNRVIPVDADKMTAQIVLSTERAAARTVRADMGLKSIGVMCRHVRLEIIRTGKC